MAHPEQLDYFFVVESATPHLSTIYARGEGAGVVSALARVTLADMGAARATESHYIPGFGTYQHDELYLATLRELAGSEWGGPKQIVEYNVNTSRLSAVMHTIGSPDYRQRSSDHSNALLDRLRDGARSPQSVHEEMMTRVEDERLLHSVSKLWFDAEGRRLTMPFYRQGFSPAQSEPELKLERVFRNDRGLDPDSKQALFDAVPQKGKAFSVGIAPFNRHKSRGWINPRSPFLHGIGAVHSTYGYIAPDSTDFVPVLTSLSDKHPARLKQ